MTMVLKTCILAILLTPIQGLVVLPSQQSRMETRLHLHHACIDHVEVAARVASTDRGRSVSPTQREELEAYFRELEARCALPAPARSPLVAGTWCVEYTDASAPSNGQLGPFKGFAYQEVDLESGRYANILKVPPNDWLTATLEATWKEWDGVLIRDDTDKACAMQPSLDPNQDYGATSWVVTFESITIKLFGVPIVSQKFKNTKRVWRTTYVDENTRIVRAGRTGQPKDEMFFYMTRNNTN
jgi:hypothetical protein